MESTVGADSPEVATIVHPEEGGKNGLENKRKHEEPHLQLCFANWSLTMGCGAYTTTTEFKSTPPVLGMRNNKETLIERSADHFKDFFDRLRVKNVTKENEGSHPLLLLDSNVWNWVEEMQKKFSMILCKAWLAENHYNVVTNIGFLGLYHKKLNVCVVFDDRSNNCFEDFWLKIQKDVQCPLVFSFFGSLLDKHYQFSTEKKNLNRMAAHGVASLNKLISGISIFFSLFPHFNEDLKKSKKKKRKMF